MLVDVYIFVLTFLKYQKSQLKFQYVNYLNFIQENELLVFR